MCNYILEWVLHIKQWYPDFGGGKVSQNEANYFARFRYDESSMFWKIKAGGIFGTQVSHIVQLAYRWARERQL